MFRAYPKFCERKLEIYMLKNNYSFLLQNNVIQHKNIG